jgi:Arc/MetJ family transcription regulator
MKTTVDIPDDVLKDAVRLTGAKTTRDAVAGAMQEHIRREKMAALVKHLGTLEDFMTLEELMDMRMERGAYSDSD